MVLHPQSFWLFFILLPIIFLFIWNFRKGRHDLFLIGGEWRKHQLYDVYLVKWFFSSLVFLLFVIFSVLAMAGFSSNQRKVAEVPPGTDIVFTIDISRSMLCDDIYPNRLKRSLDLIKGIIGKIPDERYGIVVFKGTAVKTVPVTEDNEALMTSLMYISPEILTSRGTNIEAGLNAAAAFFPEGDDRKKFILLFSDGENLSGDPKKAVKKFKEKNIEVIVFGAGTQEGKELKDVKGVPVVDKDGKKVITRLDRSVLKFIASAGKGEYLDVSNSDTLNRVVRIISSSTSTSRVEIVQRDSYIFFLSLALVSLFLYISIRIFPWKGVF